MPFEHACVPNHNCATCRLSRTCNAAMHSEGCGFHPETNNESFSNMIKDFFGKFFK